MATPLSRQAFDRLTAELEDLTTRGRVEIATTIERARELGDLKENSDYHSAKDTQGKMEHRIRQITQILADAEVVDEGGGDSGAVAAGSIVSIRYEGDEDVERYLLGSIEERRDDLAVISPTSPLGQALVGRRPGEIVTYEAPSGELKVEVVSLG